MKQILISVSIIIIALIAFGKYQQYERFNSTETKHAISETIDLNYHNQELVMNYYESVEVLNTYVSTQWNANKIDVIKPQKDNNPTKIAVVEYARKLAKVNYYESLLEQSKELKTKGLSNNEIKLIEQKGITFEAYQKSLSQNKIKSMFNPSYSLKLGEKSAFIYEIQKLLTQKGYDIPLDGVFEKMTTEALKAFEGKNQLFADGKLDVITLDLLLQ